jgi:hypothetical protein
MAAVLTSSGITFSDGTSLNSRYGIVPQSTVALFFQASAPTGWTISSVNNDAALRVVNGTGGGTGGTINFSSAFPASLKTVSGSAAVTGTVGNTTLDVNTIPNHSHGSAPGNAFPTFSITPGGGGPFMGVAPGNIEVFGNVTSSTGNSGAHTHPWSGPASLSTTVDLRCQYIDTIFCSLA